jgi:hypothetical protein
MSNTNNNVEINGVSVSELQAQLAAQQKQNAELAAMVQALMAGKQKAKRVKGITGLKVSKNGAINFCGLRKGFPLSLYMDELKIIVEFFNAGKVDAWVATNPTNEETGKGVAIRSEETATDAA